MTQINYIRAVIDCLIIKHGISNGDAQGMLEAYEMQAAGVNPVGGHQTAGMTASEVAQLITS